MAWALSTWLMWGQYAFKCSCYTGKASSLDPGSQSSVTDGGCESNALSKITEAELYWTSLQEWDIDRDISNC